VIWPRGCYATNGEDICINMQILFQANRRCGGYDGVLQNCCKVTETHREELKTSTRIFRTMISYSIFCPGAGLGLLPPYLCLLHNWNYNVYHHTQLVCWYGVLTNFLLRLFLNTLTSVSHCAWPRQKQISLMVHLISNFLLNFKHWAVVDREWEHLYNWYLDI
jgi:hypothetical protein